MTGKLRKLAMAAILLAFATTVKSQIVSVNTDVVMDGLLAPNLGVEFGLNSRSSLSLNAMYGKRIMYSDMKMTAVQPEWRFYFSGRTMYHHFVGIGALLASYNATFNERTYNGDGAGLGVTFGYVLPLSKHWNVDFHAGCGLFFYRQKEYYKNNDNIECTDGDREFANSHGSQIVPTRIGISLTYIIK